MKYFVLTLFLFMFSSSAWAAGARIPIYEANESHSGIVGPFQTNKKCQIAEKSMAATLGNARNWFRRILYGDVKQRIVVSHIAAKIQEKLLSIGKQAIERGRILYRENRVAGLGYNSDQACADLIRSWEIEIVRVLNVISAEASKGNRALEGIGIERFID